MSAADQQISAYQQALNTLAQTQDPDFSAGALPVLVARDKVAVALRDETEPPTPAAADLLVATDRRLADLAAKFEALVGDDALRTWRQSFVPAEDAWWWKVDDLAKAKQGWSKRLLTAAAVFLVTGAIAIFAETFNVLRSIGANPVSTLGVLIQGALAFIGASAFTEAGRKWLIERFSRFGKRTFKGWARTALAGAVFLVTLGFWFIVPIGAAWYFHWAGNKYYREGLYERAASSFQQASSLRPYVISYHASLAQAEEKSTNFDKAVSEYKSMTALYERPGTGIDDAYFFAKCNLVRLLISHDKNYALAEKTVRDLQPKIAQVSQPNRRFVQYLLLTYKAWIELERKHLGTARSELQFLVDKFYEGPTAHYLLALVFEELKQEAEAKKQFEEATKQDEEAKKHHRRFLELLQKPQPDEIPLEWIGYAQERTVN